MIEYNTWKGEMEVELDKLVLENYQRIKKSDGTGRAKIWNDVCQELYVKYDLTGISPSDSDYSLKKKMQNCISVSKRLYAEKEFPYELDNDRTERFVKKYNQLPKQLPTEWKSF